MIYETYVCCKADNMTEYGFCFKECAGVDDCLPHDIVLGEVKTGGPLAQATMEKAWAEHEWTAQAIVHAAASRSEP